MRALIFTLLLFLLPGCRVHDVMRFEKPTCTIPCEYLDSPAGVALEHPWWQSYQDEALNCEVQKVFCGNLDLAQSYDRLRQALALAQIAGANRLPELNLLFDAIHTKQVKGLPAPTETVPDGGNAFISFSGRDGDTIFLTPEIFYEVDLWRRIDSLARASCHRAKSAYQQMQNTALMLSETAVLLWMRIQEDRQLIELLKEQIKTNEDQLELIELRYSVGQSSGLDVYQQRLILSSTKTELPPVVSDLITAEQELSVLQGNPPCPTDLEAVGYYPLFPDLPDMGVPCDLFAYRPDLKAAFQELVAADYEVAAAIADRFPKFLLTIDYEFQAFEWNSLFQQELLSVIANIMQPLIDWGKRKAEVERRKAIVCERLHAFGQIFLNALQEVEAAIAQEKQQKILLQELENQLEIARINLEESQMNYMNGLNDYLTVIAAIQSLQNVERTLITQKKNLYLIRSRLYTSLGGNFYL